MNNTKSALLIISMCILCVSVKGQGVIKAGRGDCLILKMIEQKSPPNLIEIPASDVIVETPDDLHFRFRLKNNCRETIYYLSYTILDQEVPAGFMIYRTKENDWKTRTEGALGEGSLTSPSLYHWVPLKFTESIEFEYSDFSLIEGERSLAIYVNNRPSQQKRIELLAEPFVVRKIK